MPFVYAVSGFRVHSAIELPELDPEPRAFPRVDVRIELGPVPAALSGAAPGDDATQVERDRLLLRVPGVAGFLVERGERIVVEPAPGASGRDVRVFLLGTCWGALCHQRGLLPLHAGAVAAADGVVAIAGPSGAGKSTLVAALARRGHPVVADDVLVVRPNGGAGGAPVTSPYVQRLKLCRDSLSAVALPPHGRESRLSQPAKWFVSPPRRARRLEAPLRRIYLLDRSDGGGEGAAGFERVAGHAAVATLIEHTYRCHLVSAMGRRTEHFRLCAAIAQGTRVFSFRRGAADLAGLADAAERLEEHIRRGG